MRVAETRCALDPHHLVLGVRTCRGARRERPDRGDRHGRARGSARWAPVEIRRWPMSGLGSDPSCYSWIAARSATSSAGRSSLHTPIPDRTLTLAVAWRRQPLGVSASSSSRSIKEVGEPPAVNPGGYLLILLRASVAPPGIRRRTHATASSAHVSARDPRPRAARLHGRRARVGVLPVPARPDRVRRDMRISFRRIHRASVMKQRGGVARNVEAGSCRLRHLARYCDRRAQPTSRAAWRCHGIVLSRRDRNRSEANKEIRPLSADGSSLDFSTLLGLAGWG